MSPKQNIFSLPAHHRDTRTVWLFICGRVFPCCRTAADPLLLDLLLGCFFACRQVRFFNSDLTDLNFWLTMSRAEGLSCVPPSQTIVSLPVCWLFLAACHLNQVSSNSWIHLYSQGIWVWILLENKSPFFFKIVIPAQLVSQQNYCGLTSSFIVLPLPLTFRVQLMQLSALANDADKNRADLLMVSRHKRSLTTFWRRHGHCSRPPLQKRETCKRGYYWTPKASPFDSALSVVSGSKRIMKDTFESKRCTQNQAQWEKYPSERRNRGSLEVYFGVLPPRPRQEFP